MPVQLAFARDLGEQPSDLARPGWLDLASTGSIWLPCAPWLARSCLEWLDLAALCALAGSIWLPWSLLGALAGSIWLLCSLLGALAGSNWPSWAPWLTRFGCSGRSWPPWLAIDSQKTLSFSTVCLARAGSFAPARCLMARI